MCYADPNVWFKTEVVLKELMEKARRLLEDNGKAGRLTRKLVHELELLYRDLHSWDPDEEVCWDEFWSRITRIKKQLELLTSNKNLHDQQWK